MLHFAISYRLLNNDFLGGLTLSLDLVGFNFSNMITYTISHVVKLVLLLPLINRHARLLIFRKNSSLTAFIKPYSFIEFWKKFQPTRFLEAYLSTSLLNFPLFSSLLLKVSIKQAALRPFFRQLQEHLSQN
jgi:hypothetical protein